MEEFFIPRHLLNKIDRIHLQNFMRNEGLEHHGSKEMLIDTLIKNINIQEDATEKELLIASYHNFLLKTIKHNNNRIVITSPILTTQYSCYYSEKNFTDKFEVKESSDLNFSDVITGSKLTVDGFEEIFKCVNQSDGLIDLIEICYGRINRYKREDSVEVTNYEYVWCEIDPQKSILRIILSENSRSYIKNNSDGSRNKIQKDITSRLTKEYGIIFSEVDEKQTLFKIYKYLTSYIEAPYAKLVEPYSADIETFVEKMKTELNIEDKEDIKLKNRLTKLFERNLIQKDFKKFRTKKVEDGRIQSVNYSDEVGGNVKAKSGGAYFNGTDNQPLDLQDSRVYFDIKESIYNDEELSSITVSWVNNSDLVDDRFDEINVRYTCYRGFYITHFLTIGVREEIYDYVLPKFDDYKRRSLK